MSIRILFRDAGPLRQIIVETLTNSSGGRDLEDPFLKWARSKQYLQAHFEESMACTVGESLKQCDYAVWGNSGWLDAFQRAHMAFGYHFMWKECYIATKTLELLPSLHPVLKVNQMTPPFPKILSAVTHCQSSLPLKTTHRRAWRRITSFKLVLRVARIGDWLSEHADTRAWLILFQPLDKNELLSYHLKLTASWALAKLLQQIETVLQATPTEETQVVPPVLDGEQQNGLPEEQVF